MNIEISNQMSLTIVREEDKYYVEAYIEEDILVASFTIDAPLEGLELLVAIKANLKLLDLIK